MSQNKIDVLAIKNAELTALKKEVDKLKAEVKSQGVGSYEGNEYKAINCTRKTPAFRHGAIRVQNKVGI